MRMRIGGIRDRISFRGFKPLEIGCILIVQPVFFPPAQCVAPPDDWPERTQADKKYDLTRGEVRRVWDECLATAASMMATWTTREGTDQSNPGELSNVSPARYGSPYLIRPRLGQGTFRIAVTDAYGRGCAVTGEHSLPALEAAHIRPYGSDGPHEVTNGLLLRADLHRLFDQGYITVTPDLKLAVGRRLRQDFANGRTYYPFDGFPVRPPESAHDRPQADYLRWHNENRYLG
jgi:putative restriction endonuclease